MHGDARPAGGRTPESAADASVRSTDDSIRLFWVRHGRVGTALSLAVLVQLALYMSLADGIAHRGLLLALDGGGILLTLTASVLTPLAVRSRWSTTFFFTWSFSVVGMILAACAVDGGAQSPVTATLFLPLLYAALAYPSAAVLSIGVLEVIGYGVVAATDHTSGTAYPLVIASTVMLGTVMAARGASNRNNQQAELRLLTRQLQDQATHDPLTGCLNRRGFQFALDGELARAVRYRRSLALLFVDLDHLKEINDRNGHSGGDHALEVVAAALESAARRSDVVGRVGGDEFAVLAPEMDARDASRLARRIHTEIAELSAAGSVSVTVSIGVAAVRHPTDAAELTHAADVALYQAKKAGRNCTRFSFSEPPVPAPRSAVGSGWMPEPAPVQEPDRRSG